MTNLRQKRFNSFMARQQYVCPFCGAGIPFHVMVNLGMCKDCSKQTWGDRFE